MPMDDGTKYVGYLHDESRMAGHCSGFTKALRPEDIQAALSLGEPVTAQGARTGLMGGAVPQGGRVLNLSAYAGVTGLGRDPGGFYLDVRPGTPLEDLQNQLAHCRFDTAHWAADSLAALEELRHSPSQMFAPDPTEETASLGGMFATNAGGLSSPLYGRMADHVLAAEFRLCGGSLLRVERGRFLFDESGNCPLPDGRTLNVRYAAGRPAHGALLPTPGSDLLDLFAGSEGILGVVEGLRLRLVPRPPSRWGVVFFFKQAGQAAEFAQSLLETAPNWAGCRLAVLEYMDHRSLELFTELRGGQSRLSAVPQPPPGCAALLTELVGEGGALDDALNDLLDLFDQTGGAEEMTWAADSKAEIQKFRMLRHSVPEALNTLLDARRIKHPGSALLSADLLLQGEPPGDYLPRLQREAEELGVFCAIYGRLATGCLHIALLPRGSGEASRCEAWIDHLHGQAAANGGMPVGEYGAGKRKRAALAQYLPQDQRALMRSIKRFFDPDGLLGPGNLL